MCREIVSNAAPTLAGLKTGNLFTVDYTDRQSSLREIRQINGILSPAGLAAVPLRFSEKRILLYVYRRSALLSDLSDPERARLLCSLGYKATGIGSCISELRRRLLSGGDFPHEIGLFLGYPTEDVIGFMTDRSSGCKLIGTWRVYGDEASAREKFEQFNKCTRSYIEQFSKGVSLEKLVVA